MDFCSHLIDAAAKSGRYFLAEFFECGAAESKNFDKCHVKLLNICLIESPLQICHNNADRPVEMGILREVISRDYTLRPTAGERCVVLRLSFVLAAERGMSRMVPRWVVLR